MSGAGGENEEVVLEQRAGLELYAPPVEIEADGLIHEDFDVLIFADDGADGLRDLGRREHGEGDLIEKRLEGVMILAIDEGNVDGKLCETHRGVDSGEASSDDHDALAYGVACRHVLWLLLTCVRALRLLSFALLM